MSRKTFTKTGFVALALLLVTACGGSKDNLESRADFAQKLDSELYLRADGQKENRREVEYWKGTQLLKRVTIFYSAGGKQISLYREDGTIKVLTEWYPDPSLTVAPPHEVLPTVPAPTAVTSADPNASPAPPSSSGSNAISNVPAAGAAPAVSSSGTAAPANGSDTTGGVAPLPSAQTPEEALSTGYTAKIYDPPTKFGKVKRSIEYAADGKTIVRSSFFREDGTMAAFGRQRSKSEFELLEYLKDGRSLARVQQFNNDGDVVYMRVVSGVPSDSLTRKSENGDEVTVTFGSDGIRSRRTFKHQTGYEDIEFYKADGRSLKYIVYRSYRIEVLYFKDNGSIDHYRVFQPYDNSMEVTVYRDGAGVKKPEAVDGKTPQVAYRQTWKVVGKDANGKDKYLLTQLEEVDAAGYVSRRLRFNDKTGKLERVDYLDDVGRFLKVVNVREDGTTDNYDTYVYPPNAMSETTNTKVTGVERETVPTNLTRPLGFDDVRNVVGPPVQPSYNWYGGYDF